MIAAAAALLAVALGCIGLIVGKRLAARSRAERVRLQAHIEELEATKDVLEKMSADLTKALTAADAASKAKSEFLAAMSHELRTPLNAVIGFSEVMANEVFGSLGNPRYQEYAESIRRSGTHLLGLINDVLDMSRISSGELTLSREDIRVADLISEAVGVITLQAEANDVMLIEDVEPWLPPLRLDRRRMRQVLVNLLTNAVKFTPAEGTVRVCVHRRGENIAIEITDSGIGMSAHEIPRALEHFSQVDGSLSRKYEGAGLGLPLAKHLTELHGGWLELKSEPGVGTTATVILPPQPAKAEREAA